MTIRIKIIAALSLLLGLIPALVAHSPSDVVMNFDNETKILKVKVNHTVSNPGKHFVKKIEVFLNESSVITQNYSRQKEKDYQEAYYLLFEAEVDDKIKIAATCSIHGMIDRELTVKAQKNEGE